MLTDEEIKNVLWNLSGPVESTNNKSLIEFAHAIERAVLAKAMPIPKQEPQVIGRVHYVDDGRIYGCLNSIGRQLEDGAALYASPQPAQAAANPLVDSVFASSYKKATDTHGRCPHCSHECAQAAAIPDGWPFGGNW